VGGGINKISQIIWESGSIHLLLINKEG
jgi:hypothetical protein